MSSITSGEASVIGGTGSGRAFRGGISSLPTSDNAVLSRRGDVVPDLVRNGRSIGLVDQLPVDEIARPGREIAPLPPDASNTLYVEGLPPDSTRREVARILFDLAMLLRNYDLLCCPFEFNLFPNFSTYLSF